jgi:glycosyltransferase involved in cell wall biosynthesis
MRNLIVTLFRGEGHALDADVALDIPRGYLRRLGLDPRAVLGLRRLIRDINPGLVVAHGGEPAKYAAFALKGSTPLVYVSIGSAHQNLDRRRSSALRRYYLRRCNVVVAVSDAVASELVSRDGVPADKVAVIPNGRDPSIYRPDHVDHASGVPRLIWVGQLDVTKRPEIFIEVIQKLADEGIMVEATMVGDGPRGSELSVAAAKAGVSMTGRRADVPDLLASADLFVFTGRPPEGMPGVLIEAGMSGLATVTTRVPGADEVISDSVTGILVDVDDRVGLFEGVKSLVTDVTRRREMGIEARARCIESFSIDATISLWRELFARHLKA